jgi:hypothetical protein
MRLSARSTKEPRPHIGTWRTAPSPRRVSAPSRRIEHFGPGRIGAVRQGIDSTCAMARTKQFLLDQIARAKRIAAAMSTRVEQERFEELAAGYQRELDDAEPADYQSSPSSSADGAPASDAVAGNEGGAPMGTSSPAANRRP